VINVENAYGTEYTDTHHGSAVANTLKGSGGSLRSVRVSFGIAAPALARLPPPLGSLIMGLAAL
jgi:hypothetical protein